MDSRRPRDRRHRSAAARGRFRGRTGGTHRRARGRRQRLGRCARRRRRWPDAAAGPDRLARALRRGAGQRPARRLGRDRRRAELHAPARVPRLWRHHGPRRRSVPRGRARPPGCARGRAARTALPDGRPLHPPEERLRTSPLRGGEDACRRRAQARRDRLARRRRGQDGDRARARRRRAALRGALAGARGRCAEAGAADLRPRAHGGSPARGAPARRARADARGAGRAAARCVARAGGPVGRVRSRTGAERRLPAHDALGDRHLARLVRHGATRRPAGAPRGAPARARHGARPGRRGPVRRGAPSASPCPSRRAPGGPGSREPSCRASTSRPRCARASEICSACTGRACRSSSPPMLPPPWPDAIYHFHGPQTAREVELLGAAGVAPNAAIAAATAVPARMLGLAGELGTVELGKRADLVLVEGDPSRDLRALRRVRWTLRDGVARTPEEWMRVE